MQTILIGLGVCLGVFIGGLLIVFFWIRYRIRVAWEDPISVALPPIRAEIAPVYEV